MWYGAALRVRPSAAHLPLRALALLKQPQHLHQWTSDELLHLVDHLLHLREVGEATAMARASAKELPRATPASIAAYLRRLKLPCCGEQLVFFGLYGDTMSMHYLHHVAQTGYHRIPFNQTSEHLLGYLRYFCLFLDHIYLTGF